jgi:hypothetical protein
MWRTEVVDVNMWRTEVVDVNMWRAEVADGDLWRTGTSHVRNRRRQPVDPCLLSRPRAPIEWQFRRGATRQACTVRGGIQQRTALALTCPGQKKLLTAATR